MIRLLCVLYIRPTDLFHFSPGPSLPCKAFQCEPLADDVAWRYLGRLILSFMARAFTASTDRFNFAAIRRMDVLASIKDLRRSASSGVHLLLVLLATGDRPSAISTFSKSRPPYFPLQPELDQTAELLFCKSA